MDRGKPASLLDQAPVTQVAHHGSGGVVDACQESDAQSRATAVS